MKYTFQKYLDICTSANSVNIIKVACGGKDVLNRTKHLFGAYKYFKLGGIKIKLVPASTLPVDPRGMSYDDQDPYTVDPRDQLNPGLVRITNGENIINSLIDVSASAQDIMYTNTMLDPRWSKFMLQSGFSRYALPLYYELGEFEQSFYPDRNRNIPKTAAGVENPNAAEVEDTVLRSEYITSAGTHQTYDVAHSSAPQGLHQVGHRGRLGWMPTDGGEKFHYMGKDSQEINPDFLTPMIAPIPSIDVITIVLPRAYKTIYYYRLFITETVYFKGLKNTGICDSNSAEIRGVDNFLFVDTPKPVLPFDGYTPSVRNPQQPNDGGWQK